MTRPTKVAGTLRVPSAKCTTDFQVRRWVEDPSGTRLGYVRAPNTGGSDGAFDGLGSPSYSQSDSKRKLRYTECAYYYKRRARVPVLQTRNKNSLLAINQQAVFSVPPS
jgi:hypothetical protein